MALTTDERLAIHELIALHGHLVDGGSLDRLREVFAEDVRYDLTAVGGGVVESLVAVVASSIALGDRNLLAHLVTNVVVVEEAGEIRAVSKYLGLATDGSVGSGTYFDLLTRTTDGWRIAERRVVPRGSPSSPDPRVGRGGSVRRRWR